MEEKFDTRINWDPWGLEILLLILIAEYLKKMLTKYQFSNLCNENIIYRWNKMIAKQTGSVRCVVVEGQNRPGWKSYAILKLHSK